jgi:hypothetical protein
MILLQESDKYPKRDKFHDTISFCNNMVIKTKFWTITATIPTIAIIATMGIMGGLGQQQVALAQVEEEQDFDIDVDVDEGEARIAVGGCPAQFENCELETVISALGCDIVREIPGTGGGLECIIFFG